MARIGCGIGHLATLGFLYKRPFFYGGCHCLEGREVGARPRTDKENNFLLCVRLEGKKWQEEC